MLEGVLLETAKGSRHICEPTARLAGHAGRDHKADLHLRVVLSTWRI